MKWSTDFLSLHVSTADTSLQIYEAWDEDNIIYIFIYIMFIYIHIYIYYIHIYIYEDNIYNNIYINVITQNSVESKRDVKNMSKAI